jgi:transcription antitermination factor NusG
MTPGIHTYVTLIAGLFQFGSDSGGSLSGSRMEKNLSAREKLPWFALQVRHKHEQQVAMVLRYKGYAGFLPTYQSRRYWSDRIANVEMPLFPGYVFCQFDPADRRIPIVTTPGVVRIVGGPAGPIPVDTRELNAVRLVIASGIAAEPWPWLETGQRVRVLHGALAGLDGIFLEVKNRGRLVISVSLLQRSIQLEIDSALVAPVRAVWRSLPPLVECEGAA